MEDLYSIHPSIPRSSEPMNQFSDGEGSKGSTRYSLSESLKAQIAGHPRYPSLVSAYIDCRKVGAQPELASILEEIGRGNCPSAPSAEIGSDPELDDFMESYCQVLIRYKEELSKPFNEATSFLSRIEMQLSDLCKSPTSTSTVTTVATTATTTANSPSEEAGGSSEIIHGDGEPSEGPKGSSGSGDQELKDMLLKKYSSYLSCLRKEFLKKRKKGKLPKESRLTLLDWWNSHYRWPYPTEEEEEETKLVEATGLDQKQINNWFINQRKRHWKPLEDMQIALMEGLSGGTSTSGSEIFFNAGTINP